MDEALLTDAEEFGQLAAVEVGVQVIALLFEPQVEDGHQLTVVLQVGIAQSLHILLHQRACHFCTAAQLHVGLKSFAEVEVAAHQTHHL